MQLGRLSRSLSAPICPTGKRSQFTELQYISSPELLFNLMPDCIRFGQVCIKRVHQLLKLILQQTVLRQFAAVHVPLYDLKIRLSIDYSEEFL